MITNNITSAHRAQIRTNKQSSPTFGHIRMQSPYKGTVYYDDNNQPARFFKLKERRNENHYFVLQTSYPQAPQMYESAGNFSAKNRLAKLKDLDETIQLDEKISYLDKK